jgi:recombination protein RecT
MSEIIKADKQNTTLQVSKEQQVLMPIAEQYIQLFPEIANDKTFNAKQAIISMALKLKETKDKAGRPAIDVCTRESIAQVAQELLVKRLDPLKSQVSLIVRGDKLSFHQQYQGAVKRALELNPFLSHFNFVPIYKNDKVEMEIGKDGSYGIKSHTTSFANIGNNNLIGGYVRAIKKDGSVYMTEVMTMEQIKIAWSKSSNSSLSVHHAFPLRMVRKTILNGLCNWLINTTGEQEEYEDVEYGSNAENNVVNGMEITLDERQDYSEPSEYEEPTYEEEVVEPETDDFDEEEVTDEDWQMAMEEDSRNAVETVSYAKWKNELKGNGYEMVEGSYDTVNKTVQVRKV